MSLDVYLKDPTATYECNYLYDANITHNLGEMASEAGIYEALWRPHRLDPNYNEEWDDTEKEYEFEDNTDVFAHQITPVIEIGLALLKDSPEHYTQFDSPNGWGLYVHFVPFVEKYLAALREYPKAIVRVSR